MSKICHCKQWSSSFFAPWDSSQVQPHPKVTPIHWSQSASFGTREEQHKLVNCRKCKQCDCSFPAESKIWSLATPTPQGQDCSKWQESNIVSKNRKAGGNGQHSKWEERVSEFMPYITLFQSNQDIKSVFKNVFLLKDLFFPFKEKRL